jgi:transposase
VAKRVEEIILGVDVAKAELEVFCWESRQRRKIPNEVKAIRAWLKSFTGPVALSIEATSDYHFTLVDEAHALGHAVYVINGYQLKGYRQAVNRDHKSDPDDAWLLARYLSAEKANLRPFTPPCAQARRLWQEIKRRGSIVCKRQDLQQSLKGTGIAHRRLMGEFQRVLLQIDRHIRQLISSLGWDADYQRCLTIPGIGPGNAAALVCAFHRAPFPGSDQFIAFLGLDIRRRQSGRFEGQRKLTKRGEPELRRLLYCATKAARTYAPFAVYRERQLAKGLSKTAANMILGRKLARIAFTLLCRQQTFKKTSNAGCGEP